MAIFCTASCTCAWQSDALNLGDTGKVSLRFSSSREVSFSSCFHWLTRSRSILRLLDNGVRWTYTVDNTKGDKPVPFGFAIHPYILYQGPRSETFITIPATHLMESEKLLPTGKLLDLTGSKYDARQPKSLEGFVSDDVYFGMKSLGPDDHRLPPAAAEDHAEGQRRLHPPRALHAERPAVVLRREPNLLDRRAQSLREGTHEGESPANRRTGQDGERARRIPLCKLLICYPPSFATATLTTSRRRIVESFLHARADFQQTSSRQTVKESNYEKSTIDHCNGCGLRVHGPNCRRISERQWTFQRWK